LNLCSKPLPTRRKVIIGDLILRTCNLDTQKWHFLGMAPKPIENP
jgi:hypothetical protein